MISNFDQPEQDTDKADQAISKQRVYNNIYCFSITNTEANASAFCFFAHNENKIFFIKKREFYKGRTPLIYISEDSLAVY